MKFLHKLQSEDELKKNYYRYESEVTSIVVGGKTYNYSHLEGDFYIWVNPNDSSDWVDSDVKRNPAAGNVVYILGGTQTTIDSVVSEPLSGRDIPYNQPWASWIPGVGVNYNKYHCKLNGQEYVDLGLPSNTLWATCNIGASTSEATGGYYAWGELTTKASYSDYNWGTYRFGTDDEILKYNTQDNILYLELEDDVANVTMGGDWHIPTCSQFAELGSYTTITEETINGVSGTKFTSVEDATKAIFIPNCGIAGENGDSLLNVSMPYYWTNERQSWSSDSGLINIGDNKYKCRGLQVRACIDGSALKSPITDGSFPVMPPVESPDVN